MYIASAYVPLHTFYPINCHLDLTLQVNTYRMLTISPYVSVSTVILVV